MRCKRRNDVIMVLSKTGLLAVVVVFIIKLSGHLDGSPAPTLMDQGKVLSAVTIATEPLDAEFSTMVTERSGVLPELENSNHGDNNHGNTRHSRIHSNNKNKNENKDTVSGHQSVSTHSSHSDIIHTTEHSQLKRNKEGAIGVKHERIRHRNEHKHSEQGRHFIRRTTTKLPASSTSNGQPSISFTRSTPPSTLGENSDHEKEKMQEIFNKWSDGDLYMTDASLTDDKITKNERTSLSFKTKQNDLLSLQKGINPNIEVTIEVLHDKVEEKDELDEETSEESESNRYTTPKLKEYTDGDLLSSFLRDSDTSSSQKDGSLAPSDETDDDTGSGSGHTLEEWSSWTPCSASCGSGQQQRRRRCGGDCTDMESRYCLMKECGVDGALSDAEHKKQNDGDFLNTEFDNCDSWMKCKNPYLQQYLAKLKDLPTCPCYYPINLVYNQRIWDHKHQQFFQWHDVSSGKYRLDVYKPGASYCILSRIELGRLNLAAQHCCYDNWQRLISRGPGAGTPYLISPEVSPALHHKVDILPWIICKGDWTKYNQVRPPNNDRTCTDNPPDEIFMKQKAKARQFK